MNEGCIGLPCEIPPPRKKSVACVGKSVCGDKCPHEETTPMSNRERDWLEFSERVAHHLRTYTVPQYGDIPNDEITGYTVQECVKNVSRYSKRYGTQSREGQQELDFIKMAHYAQCAWEKYNKLEVIPERDHEYVVFDELIPDEEGLTHVGYVKNEDDLKYIYKKDNK